MAVFGGVRRFCGIRLFSCPQRVAGARNARHQCPNGNALCDCRLGITKPFDGYQVQSCALLIGKLDERLPNLAKADVVVLGWRKLLFNELACSFEALSFCASGAGSVNENIVHDRQQPHSQISSGTKAPAFFVCPNKCIMNEILSIYIAACEGAGIAT